jgi:hypothetical protein
MPDPILDELNLTTLKEIYPSVIEDNYFLDTPFQAYLRDHCLVPFGGGAFTQTVFRYKPMIGGFYARGGSFNITKRQTLAGAMFDPKYLEVAVPEYKEDIQVLNKGPRAVFKLIDEDLRNAMDTISAIAGIAMAGHGQAVVTGVNASRITKINGWPEALNDGVTKGWTGDYFTTYGTATRNGVIGSVLNSVPYWCGNADGSAGPVTYGVMEETYQDACVGNENPNLGVGNKAVIAYMKQRLQAQQVFAQEKDPIWGVMGFRFNNAIILKDDYFPSLKYGANDPDLGNYLTSTFASGSPATASNMPSSTTCTVGEVFAWLTTSKWFFRISDDPEFGFGWSGFFPAQDNTRVVGHVKAACNLECTAPRLQKQLLGIGG